MSATTTNVFASSPSAVARLGESLTELKDAECRAGRPAPSGLEGVQLRNFRRDLREMERSPDCREIRRYLSARDGYIVCSPVVEYVDKRVDQEIGLGDPPSIAYSGDDLASTYMGRIIKLNYVHRSRTYACLILTKGGFEILTQTHSRRLSPDSIGAYLLDGETGRQKWLLSSRLRSFVAKVSLDEVAGAVQEAKTKLLNKDTSSVLARADASNRDLRPEPLRSSFRYERDITELR